MGAPDFIALPKIVTPGETIDISIQLTAPEAPGTYKGIWSFEDLNGKRFGLGAVSTGEIWVQVKVIAAPTSTPTLTPPPTETSTATLKPPYQGASEILAYDFIAQACAAAWTMDDVAIPCPGSDVNAQTSITLPILEDGSTSLYPAIRFDPGKANGTIAGSYPDYVVQPGDHFRAIASCEVNASNCSALFRLSYQDSSGLVTDLWAVGEFYDQKNTEVNVDLSPLAGQTVTLILNVTSLNDDTQNNSYWVSPGIYRIPLPTATATLTATPTSTETPLPTPTETLGPTVTATPIPPQEKTAPPTLWESIKKFFSDLFKQLFGG